MLAEEREVAGQLWLDGSPNVAAMLDDCAQVVAERSMKEGAKAVQWDGSVLEVLCKRIPFQAFAL
jgi:hypothetical protein